MKKFILEEKTYTTNGKRAAKSEDILYACDFDQSNISKTLNIFDAVEAGTAFMNELPDPMLKCINGEVCLSSYELLEVIFQDDFTFNQASGTLDDQLNDVAHEYGDIIQCRFAKHAEEIFSLSNETNMTLQNVIDDETFIYVNEHGTFWDTSHGLTDFVPVYFLARNKELHTFDLSDADYGEWDASEFKKFEKILYLFKNEICSYTFEKFKKFLEQ